MAKTQKIHLVGQKNNYLLNKLLTYKYYDYFKSQNIDADDEFPWIDAKTEPQF